MTQQDYMWLDLWCFIISMQHLTLDILEKYD